MLKMCETRYGKLSVPWDRSESSVEARHATRGSVRESTISVSIIHSFDLLCRCLSPCMEFAFVVGVRLRRKGGHAKQVILARRSSVDGN